MSRNLLVIGAATVAVVAGVYLFSVRTDRTENSEVASPPPMVSASLNELPNLKVTYGDQSSVILREQPGNVVLIFFNPDCDHCHQEAEQIAANENVFDGWEVYFIASVEAKAAEDFGVKYKLTNPNFHFGSAAVSDVYNAVGALTQVPTIMIYKNKMFVEKYEGVTPIDELRKNL